MIKNNMRIKNEITIYDKISYIESVVSSAFMGENYTPYLRKIREIEAVMENFVEGIEFDDGDVRYDCYEKDNDLQELVGLFQQPKSPYYAIYIECKHYIDDIIEYEKEKIIQKSSNSDVVLGLSTLSEGLVPLLETAFNLVQVVVNKDEYKIGMEFAEKLNKDNITLDDISRVVKETAKLDFESSVKDIIDEKNKQIEELKKYKLLYEARNITNNNLESKNENNVNGNNKITKIRKNTRKPKDEK